MEHQVEVVGPPIEVDGRLAQPMEVPPVPEAVNEQPLMAVADNDYELTCELADYLYMRTYGKVIDKNYRAYVAALVNAYVENRRLNMRRVARVMDRVIEMHLRQRSRALENDPINTAAAIQRVNEMNQQIVGVVVEYPWWNLWRPIRTQIQANPENDNPLRPIHAPPNWWKGVAITSGVAVSVLTIKCLTSGRSLNPTNTSIIPRALKPPMPLLAIGTMAKSWLSTTLEKIGGWVSSCADTYATPSQ